MVVKDDFTPLEWEQIQEGPLIAGVLVILASPNIMGIPKESIAMMKAVENTESAGAAKDLATLIVADLDDDMDRSTFGPEGSPDEVKDELTERLAASVGIIDEKCTPDEAAGYREWIAGVALATAEASKEGSFFGIGGRRVTEEEDAMLRSIDSILGR